MQWLRSKTLNKIILFLVVVVLGGSALTSLHFLRHRHWCGACTGPEAWQFVASIDRFCFLYMSFRMVFWNFIYWNFTNCCWMLNVILQMRQKVLKYLLNCITQLLTTKFYWSCSSILLHLIFTKIRMQQVQWVFLDASASL